LVEVPDLEVREEVRQLALTLAEEEGFELVDVEFLVQGGRRTVRVLLDRPEGIRVADCATFSRRISDCLDMNQTIHGRYTLEVSSPGMDRPLKSLEHLQRFAGRRATFTTIEPRDGRRHYEGEILGPDGARAGLKGDDGQEYWFDWDEVKTAHLVADPWAERRQEGGRT
jgi:ribosome maturation factor RimP